jgi:hypothetical protein
MKKLAILGVALFLLGLVGEVKCIVKAINCNWQPIGKAEVIYTAGVFTGAGCIIGWFDIEDK